jgi:ArsR family transcriptional regulator
MVDRRREGTTIYYRVSDSSVFRLCELVCGRLEDALERKRKALR